MFFLRTLFSTVTIVTMTMSSITLAANTTSITVHDAWVRIPPPGARTTAGYLSLKNAGKQPVTIKRVAITGAESAEIHTTKIKPAKTPGGEPMMSMEKLAGLSIAPGSASDLTPGGTHLMIFGLAKELTEGMTIDLIMTLDDGSTVKTKLKARVQ